MGWMQKFWAGFQERDPCPGLRARRLTEEVLEPRRLSVMFGGDEQSVEEDDDDH